jgi:hypothetical protein
MVFTGLFVYIWKGIQPHLLYYGFGVLSPYPLFSWDGDFLRLQLSSPGGPVSVLSRFLSQYYYQSWMGAGIIVAALWLVFMGTRQLLLWAGVNRGRDLAFVLPLIALAMVNRYDHPLQVVLAIGMSVWIAVLYLALPTGDVVARTGAFALLYGACYCLGGASALVFAVSACLAEGLCARRFACAGLCAFLAVAATLILGWGLFGLSPRQAFAAGTPSASEVGSGLAGLSRWLAWGLYAAAPLALLWSLSWLRLGPYFRRRRTQKWPSSGPSKPTRRGRARPYLWAGVRASCLAGLCVAVVLESRTVARYEWAMHYQARQRNWTEILRLAAEMKVRHIYSPVCQFDIDRALAHLGRMGDDLCAYAQDVKVLSFLSLEGVAQPLRFAKMVDLDFDLGDLNAAERDAYELLEMQGPCPFILEALARVHIAKGEYAAAKVPLKLLQRSPAFRTIASRWLEELADAARLAADKDVASWRKWARHKDHDRRDGSYFDEAILDLLQDHPDNRLAFEYLVGYYLLTRQRAKLADSLGQLRSLGYERLPKHVAEALLIETALTHKPINLQGWRIDSATGEQFQRVAAAIRALQGNPQAAALLAPQFGDTYTFYSAYRVSGAKYR